jgi:hypothetical protein
MEIWNSTIEDLFFEIEFSLLVEEKQRNKEHRKNQGKKCLLIFLNVLYAFQYMMITSASLVLFLVDTLVV